MENQTNCGNCRNLKVGRFNFQELKIKWDSIYHPTNMTDGYKNRYLKESNKLGIPFGETKMRYVYCDMGLLSRFYIVRGSKAINIKASLDQCSSYK